MNFLSFGCVGFDFFYNYKLYYELTELQLFHIYLADTNTVFITFYKWL